MKKNTRVGWVLLNGKEGSGVTITDEEDGHILVAVDPLKGGEGVSQSSLEFHPVIRCTVTWLTERKP